MRTPYRRRLIIATASTALSATVSRLQAQTLAGRLTRLVVPYPVGGGSDFAARVVAQKLLEALQLKVLVENRPGASGSVGTDYVAKSPADGSVLLFCDTSHAVNAALHPAASFDPVGGFVPLTLVGSSPLIMAAHPSFPVNSLKELVALGKVRTEAWAIGSSGQGSSSHLAYEMVHAKTGLTLLHVPYKGGASAIADVVAGQIPLVINSLPACMPHILAKRLKPLAIASKSRDSALAHVQTFDETGPGIVVSTWYGVLAPAHTPTDTTDQLTAAILRVLNDEDLRKRFQDAFLSPMPQGKQAFVSFLDGEVRRWKDVVAQLPKIAV